MSMTDPLADMIVRIRNGQAAGKSEVVMPSSKIKTAVCRVLKDEGYIADYEVIGQTGGKAELRVQLKYYKGQPVIESFERVSKPGRRIYRSKDKLPVVLGGLGTAIVSTSKGVMTDKEAREGGHGGEVLCLVS
ncbi:30S ribosomal protein S8 [Methylocaldum szegediense]|uniref:Small ribosomal subunit protein uS8 n=1 Tax=Methylocaldum szegediense TaxID=73780 RepID=A0ABM9I5M7_9GAMM|nr:30S ribosomal protein S8 [Methylocaldum szegediense]CAI8908122.1 30S ribosomal subunit protein S8 [Methylocaldum szegediense]